MTSEAFIQSLTHPRRKELAGILLAEDFNSEELDTAALVEKGFNRITVIEMAREISRQVIGMQDFAPEWPRNEEGEKTAKEVAAEKANAPAETVELTEDDAPVVDAVADVIEAPVVEAPVVEAPVVDAVVADAVVVETETAQDRPTA
tara:strand:- start:7223 stop:7663 length:441 start_codon:yes stop_codon:yes gene_type:complete